MLGLQHGYLLSDILELADVAVPVVVLQQLGGLSCQADRRTAIAVAKVERKLTEQQGDILFAVTQGGYAYLYGIESVVEVLAELTVLYGAPHIEVGGGYDAYVGLEHLGAAHADILAALQHAQQLDLGLQRHLAHLVEEERTAVSDFEVALLLGMRIGIGAAFVSEELAIHRALGDGAAVDGKVGTVLTGRTVVDDAREMLFADARLTRDEYTQIRRGYLDGNLDGAI